jgi:hypothetical protein
MTRRAAYACAAVLGFLGVLGVPSSSTAASNDVPRIELHLSRTVVVGGDPVTVTARANTLCDWILTFHGERRHTVARSIRTTFTTPEVDHRTRLNVVATCVVHTVRTRPERYRRRPARARGATSRRSSSGSRRTRPSTRR